MEGLPREMNAVPQLVEHGGQSVDYEASPKFTRSME
jgi:hypothetical protein